MQRLLEIPQEVYDFLRNFRLRAGDLNREGGSKTAPFTHPLPGVPAPLAGVLILQQALLFSLICTLLPLPFRYFPVIIRICARNSQKGWNIWN